MLEIDPKELRKIEAVCFKEAKRNTPTNAMNIYVNYLLNNVTAVFLSHFFRRFRRDEINADDGIKKDFESVYATLSKRLSKYAEIEKNPLTISFREGVTIHLEPYYSGYYSTGFLEYRSFIPGDEILRFCDVVEFIADRIPIWKPIAERIKFAVQKELMKNKISSTAVEALLKAKLNPLGLQYETLVKPQSCNVKIRLSDKKVIKFYLKNAKFLANPDAFVNLITTLDGFVAKGNDFRVKKYYKSNDNHFWI